MHRRIGQCQSGSVTSRRRTSMPGARAGRRVARCRGRRRRIPTHPASRRDRNVTNALAGNVATSAKGLPESCASAAACWAHSSAAVTWPSISSADARIDNKAIRSAVGRPGSRRLMAHWSAQPAGPYWSSSEPSVIRAAASAAWSTIRGAHSAISFCASVNCPECTSRSTVSTTRVLHLGSSAGVSCMSR